MTSEEIREQNFKVLESNDNETTTYQNPWETTKVTLRRKLIAVSACIQTSAPS
jgi:hypothetical protein